MVIQDTSGSSVSPTTRLSILKHLLENNPDTLQSTPALFSTKTEYILFIRITLTFPYLQTLDRRYKFARERFIFHVDYFTRSIGSTRHSINMVLSSLKNSLICSLAFVIFSTRINGISYAAESFSRFGVPSLISTTE